MDYKNYLFKQPPFSGLPRNFVVMRSSNGEEKIYHIDNRKLNGPVTGGPDGEIYKAIKDYFNSNKKILAAEIYVLGENDRTTLIKTINNK